MVISVIEELFSLKRGLKSYERNVSPCQPGRTDVFRVRRRTKTSAPRAGLQEPEPWPSSVAQTCPKRTKHLECFRADIRAAMQTLSGQIADCFRAEMGSMLIKLRVETKAGKPTCVHPTPSKHEAAQCIAKLVANKLTIPRSPDDEKCEFNFPIRFDSSPNPQE